MEVTFMDSHFTNIQEIFNEIETIKNNIAWYRVYNTTVKVQLCYLDRKKYYISGKPKVYTFDSLNLLNHFVKMLGNCKLQNAK